MSLFDKISDFFIPYEPRESAGADDGVEIKVNVVPAEKNPLTAMNQELWQLMERGELEKARQAAHEKNYFNQHPSLSLYAIQAGDFRLVSELSSELLTGPLFSKITAELQDGVITEPFFLNRTLYLADYAHSQWGTGPAPEANQILLRIFYRNPDFQDFTDRFHSQLAKIETSHRKEYLSDRLRRHLALNAEKLHEVIDLRNNVLAIDPENLSRFQLASLCLENNLAELVEYGAGEAKPKNLAIIEVAKNNLHHYLREGQPIHYPASQAKMDVVELSSMISLDGLNTLARKLSLLDLYPLLAYRFLQNHDYRHATETALDFVEQSKIFQNRNDFEHEVIKDQILSLLGYTLRHLNKLECDLCQSFLRQELPPAYTQKLRTLSAARSYSEPEFYQNVVMPLISTSKNIFNYSKPS